MADKKPKVGDPVRLDGKEGKIGGFRNLFHAPKGGKLDQPIRLEMARLDVPGEAVDANAADLCRAPEGFWYLPHRVGPGLPADMGETSQAYRERVMGHAEWARGRDDLAQTAVRERRG